MNRATNGQGNNSSRDEWQTPQWLFDKLNKQYWFMYDCCASSVNTKCPYYSDDFESVHINKGVAWMNPPFSIAKRMFTHFFRVVDRGIAIYRCDNLETQLWQKLIFPKATWIFIPEGRIEYEGASGKGARFPSALIGLNLPKPRGLNGKTLML